MKRNTKRNKKIRNLVLICTLSAILLTVSTYAWFIGMKKVSVSAFDVEIATTEGLYLSTDGVNWEYHLENEDLMNAYEGNANVWAETDGLRYAGLDPISTVGDMDKTSSRMKLYEKSSLTTTTGGYRLMTSRVDNHTKKVEGSEEYIEGDGYVAFDLFIKNLSGDEYYPTNDPKNEEAIYLTYDSAVTIGDGNDPKTGIQNSVRVAFAQIGRVIATTTEQDKITGINCTGDETPTGDDAVTGICRKATIWEPNDTAHVTNAINWYNTACKAKTAADTYSGTCNTLVDGVASPTYAIANALDQDAKVDIYDGKEFNKYEGNTISYEDYLALGDDTSSAKLVEYPYYTDTTKGLKGNQRVEFMTLAPNSITKVRVYIYLEGQDIDNYDFASLGKSIKVNFGFTKERIEEEDIDYEGPELVTGDDND